MEEKYFEGARKVAKLFEHKGRHYVRLEGKKDWDKREALLTFHFARMAYILFPGNIPYPRLVRKNSEKGTYSIYSEFVTHDPEHSVLTEIRNKFYKGGAYKLKSGVTERVKQARLSFRENPLVKALFIKFCESGLISDTHKGFELVKENVIFRDSNPVYIDFVNPFSIHLNKGAEVWVEDVDFKKIINYTIINYDLTTQEKIFGELKNIYKLLPENLRTQYKYLTHD